MIDVFYCIRDILIVVALLSLMDDLYKIQKHLRDIKNYIEEARTKNGNSNR